MAESRLCHESELESGTARAFKINEKELALVKIGEEFFCIDDVCSHGAFSLSEGEVDDQECTLECPKHGSLFDLKTGEPVTLPATIPVSRYAVTIKDGEVFVEL